MAHELTILCENTVTGPDGLIGEHGFACLVETQQGRRFLFDTGQGLGLLANARRLAKDLSSLDGIILSHGHRDHGGGLPAVLEQGGAVEVLVHPDAFRERYWVGRYEKRPNGLPFSREEATARGARIRKVRGFTALGEGLFLSGEVPRRTPFETGDAALMCRGNRDGALHPDPFADDLSLAIDGTRGLTILLGCAHAGLANIVNHFREQTGREQVYALLGGTHLGPADDRQFRETVRFLRETGVERLGLSHCTGLARSAQLATEFPDRVFFANVGTCFKVQV